MTAARDTREIRWHRICRFDEVHEGKPKGVDIDGAAIGIFRVGDRCHAVGNICTHEYALLSEGWQEGGTIECPLHQARFSVTDGTCHGPLAEQNLQVYEVRIQDGDIHVLIEPSTPNDK
jgi:nitrite reductase/ring-hydroxylating ferredoxin subunit